ncbi:MAG: Multi-sensor hybrid histidine kinase [candidate division TA06 bacterium 32_111]|uniref:histidine kinase n=2 Tax=Bacteria candidate phyla TaxID=1783234 RepID=A0A101I4B4_UNCT6|nr:MAG: Multi-sensor hybrid histidine kinase [candidate division TA06 bacterium 32_111]KUK88279.1 MAG: Multi-sensor hybrid histidine kinase [candidate division TA06 bacterium 34_109]HAF07212.1 hypothetical protein [candidate division WOR-3 bacterium]HCP17136.1 hypothetical protein [candidate division WOR-3 bacterium]
MKIIINLILVLHLSFLYPLLDRVLDLDKRRWKIFSGIIFSIITIIVMKTSFHITEGIIYDGRSIILGYVGFFGGFIPLLITTIVSVTYRLILGGSGFLAGILTILLCGFSGYLFRRIYYRKVLNFSFFKSILFVTLFSYILSFLMLFSQLFLLPLFSGFDTMKKISFAVLTYYPLTSAITFLLSIYILRVNKEKKELLESLLFQSDIIKEVNLIFVHLDKEGRIVEMNRESENITGYKLEEIVGKNWFELFIPKDYEKKVYQVFESVKKGNLPETFENPIRTKNGNVRYIIWKNIYLKEKNEIKGTLSFGIDITEKKLLEKRLAESEELFRKSFKEHNSIQLLIDPENGQIVDANKAATDFYGYSFEELTSMKISQINTLSEEEVKKRMDEAKSLKRNHFQFKHRLKDDRIRDVEVYSRGFEYQGKHLLHSIIFDVTEKIEFERKLKESEESFRVAVEGSDGGIFDWNIQNGEMKFSKRLKDIVGYEEDEIEISVSEWENRIHPLDYENVMKNLSMYFSGRVEKYHSEYRMKKKDGGYVWVRSTGKIISYTDDGKPLRMVGIIIDIDSIKRIEEELRRKEKYYKDLFELSPYGIFILRNDTIVDCNKKCEEIFSCNKKYIIGKTPYELSPQKQPNGVNSKEKALYYIKKALVGEDISFDWIHRSIDGKEFECEINLGILEKEKGIILAFIKDVSDRVKKEKEIYDLREQLFRAQKLETIGNFAGGIAHDFNNVLSVIIANCELLLESLKEEKERKSIENILKVSLDASSIVKRLLLFGKENAGKPEVLNLNREIKDMEMFLRKVVGENIELVYNLDENVKNIFLDKVHLEQVILNLLLNSKDAIKGNGKIVLETMNVNIDNLYIRKHYGVEEGEYVMLSVSDDGCGIKKSILDKIFDPFFTTKGEKGTGLGLSVVYGIVKSGGGFINFYSEEGVGTTFKIYFPVTDKKRDEKKIKEENIDLKGYGKKVLVVEDEKILREVIEQILTNNGYDVTLAVNGEQGLKYFKEKDYDLVVTDLIMPKMNGITLYEEMKKLKDNFKIILMSGYSKNGFENLDFPNRELPFINKPFRSHDFLKLVKKLIGDGA